MDEELEERDETDDETELGAGEDGAGEDGEPEDGEPEDGEPEDGEPEDGELEDGDEPDEEPWVEPPPPKLSAEALLALADSPGLWLPVVPSLFIFRAEDFAFVGNGRSAWVHQLRLEDDAAVQRAVGRVAAIMGLKEFPSASWWISELTEPEDLFERLQTLGLEPDEPSELTALALQEPPQGEPSDEIEIKRVETIEEMRQAFEIDWAAFAVAEEERELRRSELEGAWPQLQANAGHVTYLALIDGEPVGFGRVVFAQQAGIMLGGATVPEARGKGVYTALVHARWREAESRRQPRLTVSAGPLSAPILQNLGFEPIGGVRVLRQRL